MKLAFMHVAFGMILSPLANSQSMTVTAEPYPDESVSQSYMALDRECRNLVSQHVDPTQAVAACKKVANEADQYKPQSHFITRRAAYVFYTTALIQAKQPQLAVETGDKAVAVVLLGHDDASGSSAAYSVRGQAKAIAGDLAGADQDVERAEVFQRNALNSPVGQDLKAPYTRAMKGLLIFHAQILTAMGKQSAANIKLELANKL